MNVYRKDPVIIVQLSCNFVSHKFSNDVIMCSFCFQVIRFIIINYQPSIWSPPPNINKNIRTQSRTHTVQTMFWLCSVFGRFIWTNGEKRKKNNDTLQTKMCLHVLVYVAFSLMHSWRYTFSTQCAVSHCCCYTPCVLFLSFFSSMFSTYRLA